jgi:hypothetical protein
VRKKSRDSGNYRGALQQSDGGYAPSYNAQISTDAKQTIIVAAEVSQ